MDGWIAEAAARRKVARGVRPDLTLADHRAADPIKKGMAVWLYPLILACPFSIWLALSMLSSGEVSPDAIVRLPSDAVVQSYEAHGGSQEMWFTVPGSNDPSGTLKKIAAENGLVASGPGTGSFLACSDEGRTVLLSYDSSSKRFRVASEP